MKLHGGAYAFTKLLRSPATMSCPSTPPPPPSSLASRLRAAVASPMPGGRSPAPTTESRPAPGCSSAVIAAATRPYAACRRPSCPGCSARHSAATTPRPLPCCVSPPLHVQNASVARADQFLRWEKVEKQSCDDVMTSAVYMDTPEETMSLEYGVVELGWWVNGICAGDEAGGQCVAEATCADVDAPSGSVGHRCVCVAGMNGDGFLAGDGCYVGGSPHDVVSSSKVRQIFIVIGLISSLGITVFFFIYGRKRRNALMKTTKQLPKKAAIFFNGEVMEDELEQGASGPRRFSYSEIAVATDNFSNDMALGRGGFGFVYQGFISDMNREVAVKRVSETSRQGWKEFVSEVRIISRLRHRNLVQLIGWCHGGDELLLVYDLMHNGSLDTHLYRSDHGLTWLIRYDILLGVASALLYLHQETEQ
uniref:Protein kinase domain-containing protein n=3 Tax=Aegilops tauschii TaxID=37682 RepID=A0A453JQ32_AEGTS